METLRGIHVTQDIPVVRAGGVHEEKGVAGWGGVHDDELMTSRVDGVAELLEHRYFLGTGAA